MAVLNSRSRIIKQGDSGRCVLYVMRRDQRLTFNHALLQAQKIALEEKLPLAVVFCLQPKTQRRSREQYEFMLEGLAEVERQLAKHTIPLLTLIGSPKITLTALIYHTQPSTIVFDFSPLSGPRHILKHVTENTKATVIEVDTHNIVPVWAASSKQEIGARTLRPKIHRLLGEYLIQPPNIQSHPHKWPGKIMKLNQLTKQINDLLQNIPKNGVLARPSSGANAAKNVLDNFLNSGKLAQYSQNKNNPNLEGLSELSPYLHFGQISALEVALRVQEQVLVDSSYQQSSDVFLEELVVRKELSDNFCNYSTDYKSIKGAPAWAQKTLADHSHDMREFTYSFEQLTNAETHDSAWNACQKQLTTTGKMHGYMRMYWAKKILEWTENPVQALDYALRLNDFYSWDGGDPNGYVGVLWSIAGLHDRPWFDRPVYGTVRYMNYNGLKRKFDVAAYEKQWL